jgi:hypothetical protein
MMPRRMLSEGGSAPLPNLPPNLRLRRHSRRSKRGKITPLPRTALFTSSPEPQPARDDAAEDLAGAATQ